MHAAGKMFGKISLKAIRDTFFLIRGLWSGEGQGWQFFFGGWGGEGDIQKKGKVQTFGLAVRPPNPPFSGTSESPHKENPEEGTWPAYCNCFEKSVVFQYVLVL